MINLNKFSTALIDSNIPTNLDLANIDIIEVCESGVFDNIPGIGEIISTTRSLMNLRDKLFLKKFIRFLQTYDPTQIPIEKLEVFKKKIQSDKKYRTKIMEGLIEYIDDLKRVEKIEILAHLFTAYINDSYSWEYFLDLSDCLMRANLNCITRIPEIDTFEGKEVKEYDEKESSIEADMISSGLAMELSIWSSDIYPTFLGKDLFKYGFPSKC
jgi:hypothetical protein|nr:MAG TPA: hypothetical protein [Caudoviricetes sp.]